MKVYQYLRQRAIGLPDCDGCSVNIALLQGDSDFKVSVMSINGSVIGDVHEAVFETLPAALDFYDQQSDLFSQHPYHPEALWADGVPNIPQAPAIN